MVPETRARLHSQKRPILEWTAGHRTIMAGKETQGSGDPGQRWKRPGDYRRREAIGGNRSAIAILPNVGCTGGTFRFQYPHGRQSPLTYGRVDNRSGLSCVMAAIGRHERAGQRFSSFEFSTL
jgi:hypothetical protein